MKINTVLCFLILSILVSCNTTQSYSAQDDYKIPENPTLIWADEFEDSEIDLTKWTYEIGNGFMVNGDYIPGWGTGELEYFTDSSDNIYIDNGKLVIKAIKENYTDDYGSTFGFTSGKLATRKDFAFRYGRVEIRAKCPEGAGYWPAAWMLPANGKNINSGKYGLWAASGEVDILEVRGSRIEEATGAIHYGGQWPDNTYSSGAYTLPGDQTVTDFHTYTMDWEPGVFRWYVDGELYSTIDEWYSMDEDYNDYPFPAPFDKPFYLILQLAIGGKFDGNPKDTTMFPGTFEIDYIRVYQ